MGININLVNNIQYGEQFTKIDSSNLKTIWNRKSGQLLYATSEGKLKPMWIWQRVMYSLSSSYRESTQQGVKNSIKDLTDHIDALSFKEKDADVKEASSHTTKEAFLTELFFKKLAPLSRGVYTRDLKESVVDVLSTQITVKPEELEANPTDKYKQVYPVAKLWAKLGNIKGEGGASGSYSIIQGTITKSNGTVIEEKALGIFKPFDEEPLAPSNNRTMQKIKRFFLQFPILSGPIRGSLFKTVAGQAYLAEATSKIVERHVVAAMKDYMERHPNQIDPRYNPKWLELVTDTQVATLDLCSKKERIGSFQLWVEDKFQEACTFFDLNEYYKKESVLSGTPGSLIADMRGLQPTAAQLKQKLPSELFDMLAIIDYTIGNGDRHGYNWFVTVDQTKAATGIKLIDGGQAMAPEHPGFFSFLELHKRYLWRNLNLSKEKFTDLGKFVIAKLEQSQKELSTEIEALYTKHQPRDGATTQNRLEKMRDRINVMHRYQDRTKNELAAVRTHRDFRKALA